MRHSEFLPLLNVSKSRLEFSARPVWDPRRESEGPPMGFSLLNVRKTMRLPEPALFFSERGVGTKVVAPVWDPRRESEVPAMGYENQTFPNKPQSLPCFFQKGVWGQKLSPQSGTQDEKVRSLPWATKIKHFQTSFRACLVFFRNGCGDKCFRPSLGPKTRK